MPILFDYYDISLFAESFLMWADFFLSESKTLPLIVDFLSLVINFYLSSIG